MKSEKQIRDRANKIIKNYFNKKYSSNEKPRMEAVIKELIWVLDETLLIDHKNNVKKLVGKKSVLYE